MKPFFFILTLLSISPPLWAASGRTADGCTYKVINGQYLTDCSQKKNTQRNDFAPSANYTYTAAPSLARPTSYSDVPVRESSIVPSTPPATQNYPAILPLQPDNSSKHRFSAIEENSDYEVEKPVGVQNYFSVMATGTTFKENKNDSALGFGLAVGSNFDNYFGLELGYSYVKQDQKLGLAARGETGTSIPTNRSDASLSSHLISLETQGHFTGIESRFRPYLGIGLGWKSSTLQEKQSLYLNPYDPSSGYNNQETGSLKQTSLGALASAGLKFRASKKIFLGLSYRYFAPFSRRDAILNNPNQDYSYNTTNGTKLIQEDDRLTGSAQQQFLGGIEYIF